MRLNFSFAARYSLKFTRCSLQNPLITRCKSCSLQKFSGYLLQNLLVTCCRSCSLQKNNSFLVAKFARYSLQKLVAANVDSLFVAKFARYSLLKLLVAKKSLITLCEIRLLLVAKNHSLLVAEVSRCKKSFATC